MCNEEQSKSCQDYQRKTGHSMRLRWAVAMAVAAAAAAEFPAATAQGTAPELMPLEEVIVTARRREESAQDIPVAVTAMSEDFLREQNITRMDDLGIHVPSFRVSDVGTSTNSPLVTLRGQRPSDLRLTVDPAVPIYFAEVVLTPNRGTNLALYDLANVQVLKGPQGTLFGRNSTGGAMIVTPRTPGDELGGYAEARIGNYDLRHVEGAVDLPASDSLRFRIAGRSIDRDGYQSNVADNALKADDKYWDEDSYGARFTMEWTPIERLSNLTTVAYDENEVFERLGVPQIYNSDSLLGGRIWEAVHNGGFGVGPTGVIEAAVARQVARDDWQDVEIDAESREKVENWFFANTTEFDLNDNITLKNIFGYRDLKVEYGADTDGLPLPLTGAQTSRTEHATLDPPLGELDAKQYSEELQLLGDSLDGDLEWIVGAFWMKMEGSDGYPSQQSGPNPDWPEGGVGIPQLDVVAMNGFNQISPAGDVENEAWAIFGEGTYTFNPEWSFTLGLRQTWDDRYFDAQNYSFSLKTFEFGCAMLDENYDPLPVDACSLEVDKTFDAFTWRASVNWTPTDAMLLYGSVSTGYRTGGFNMRGTSDDSLEPFDEETVLTYELGHKTDWDIGNLALMRTNLALYFQEYDDIQKTISAVNPETQGFETFTTNAAKAEIWGVEFDITVAPVADLVMTLGWSYVDAEYKEWDRFVQSLDAVVDYTRAPFVYVPEHSLTGSVSYTLPLDADIGDISLMATAYWQDEMETNDDPWLWPELGWSEENLQEALATAVVDDYTVWNFRIDWRAVMGSGFDVAVFVNNAFDEDYVTGGLSVPEDLGLVNHTYGPPRTYGASLRWNF